MKLYYLFSDVLSGNSFSTYHRLYLKLNLAKHILAKEKSHLMGGITWMINNLRHNYLWLISALETYGLADYFIKTHSTGNFTPPPNSVLDMLDDPPFIFLLGVVGTIALVYSLWNVQHFHYKTIMTASLTFVWLLFLCGFVIHDQLRGNLLSIPSMYSFFVLIRIVLTVLIKG